MRFLATAIILAAAPCAALADEISGDWCSSLGAHVRIEGNRIQSPGGQWTDGVYERHSYAFTIPDGEADAGADVSMRQMSEERVLYTVAGRDAEEWRRCKLIS